MKKLKTFKYLALSVFMTFFMVFNHENSRAQQSSNFRIALYDIGATGVSPSQSVSSSSFSLSEGMVEKLNCNPQQSSLYRFLPGMIFPEQEELSYCGTNLYLNGCVLGDGLKSFVLGEIENLNSGCSPNGFGDYSDLVAIIQTSLNYTMYVTGGYSTLFLSVWIDLNDNYSFEEAERIVTDYSMPNAFVQYSIPLNLPAGSNEGLHRLRARVRYNSPCLDPCATYTYGEVEDYSVYVVNNPAFGTITGTITNNLTGVAVAGATVTDDSGMNSTVSGPDGNYVLNNLPAGNRTVHVTKPGYLPYSSDEVLVLPDATATCNIALTPVLEYCTSNLYSVGCQSGDNINNFILGTIQNLNTGCSPGGYGDYTAMSTNLVSGNTYPVQIASQYGQQHVCIWIDWNDNYYFDENEKILNDSVIVNANQNYTFNVTIPINASSGTHRLRVRCAWATNPSDPCSSYNYGEAEDYTVTLSEGVETGIIAGTITNISTGLPIIGAQITDATGIYSVLSGADGVYELNNLPVGSYVLNITKAGYADYTSISIAVEANQTTVFDVALSPVQAYCNSNLYTIGCQFGDYIDSFVLGDIHNQATGCSTGGYGDFTNLSTAMLLGNTYPLQITNHVGSQYLCLWIDLNNSYSFENDERLINNTFMPGSSQTYTFDLAVPVSASPGEYRLRVRTAWNVNPADPCAVYQYGETEDYTVILSSGVQTGTIAGTVTSSETGLPVQGATVADASGVYSATTGIDGHYELSGLPSGIYTLNVSKLYYQLFTSDPISLSSGQTITANFVLTPSQGYCVSNLYSTGCSGGDNINNFVLGSIQNTETGCSALGYGDFTELSTTLETGNTYDVQITSQYWQQHICLWIDWNDSYFFDPNERLLTNQWMQLPNVPYTFQITIPESATPGLHRLRVRTVWNTDYFDPCATYQYGEVEDYSVILIQGIQTGNISGTVTDNGTGLPLSGATISDAGGIYTATSGAEGQYQLTDLPAGNYTLHVSKLNYQPFISSPVSVIAGETTTANFTLSPILLYGAIAGVITDTNTGLPLEGATIADASANYSATSGADGYYELTEMPAGTYTINAGKTGYEPFTTGNVIVSAGETTTLNIALIPVQTYCTTGLYSVGCGFGDYLDDFVFADIQNMNSGCSPNSYGDFTAMSANVVAGNIYTLQASVGYNLHRLSVWIDMNDDQVFDVSEKILSDLFLATMGTTYSAEIMIPADALPGSHRLRARTNYSSSSGSACDTYLYGEVEDYTIVISIPQVVTQEILIDEGWSGISTYIVPETPAIQTLFQDIVDNIVIVQNGTGVYWPSQQINTIGNWDNNVGYKVKASDDVVLNISGFPVNPAQIMLNSGWNILPVISQCIVNTEELLAGEAGNLVVLKEIAGTGVYWPDFGVNTLPVLLPGKSYYIDVMNGFTLNFADCGDNSDFTESQKYDEKQSPWGEISFTPLTHQIGIPARFNKILTINSIIGAFTSNNLCAGYVVFDGENSVLTLFGDDPLTINKDGFEENEQVRLKIFNANETTDRQLIPSFDPDFSHHDGLFHNNGLSVISDLEYNALSANNQQYSKPVIFPNPADETLFVQSPVQIQMAYISDLLGKRVLTIELNQERTFNLNLSALPEGLYTIILLGGNEFFVQKFIRKKQ